MNDAGRVGFLVKGEYSADTTYEFLDIVYYNYSAYVAKKTTTGNEPQDNNEYWQLFARGVKGEKGDKGDQGLQGIQGPVGAQGVQGVPGEAGTSVIVQNTSTEYQVSDSGTAVPSTWQASIPEVPKGKYLWTKVSVTFSGTSNVLTYYTVAYNGKDGNSELANSSKGIVNVFDTRPSTLNVDETSPEFRNKLTFFLATSAANNSGTKPPGNVDARIINVSWDNDVWAVQLALASYYGENDYPKMYLRGVREDNKLWGSWIEFLSSKNYLDYTIQYLKKETNLANVNNPDMPPYIANIENVDFTSIISGFEKFWYALNLGHYSNRNFSAQILMPYASLITDSEIFIRTAHGSSWRPARRVLHDGNYTKILTSYMRLKYMDGYLGMADSDLSDQVWIRTTAQGIIPYRSGNRGSGHSSLGTNSWYYANAYIDHIYSDVLQNKYILSVSGAAMGSTYYPLINLSQSNKITFGTAKYDSAVVTPYEGIYISIGTPGGLAYLNPSRDANGWLGQSGVRWAGLYAKNAAILTSDKTLKKDVSYIGKNSDYDTYMDDETLIEFIKGLQPCIYRFIDNDSNRPHHGFIAQDIEKLMQELGIKDHAGFIKSPKTKTIEIEEEVEETYTDEMDGQTKTRTVIQKREEQKEIPGEYIYSLRYEELISDLTRAVQILIEDNRKKAEIIQEQDSRIKELENRMSYLESLVLNNI